MVRGALVGLLFALVVGIWPAHASVSNVAVTSPTQNQVIAGTYNSDGAGSGFNFNVRGKASTNCSGFSKITFKVTGPNSYSYSPSSWSFSYGGSNYSSGPSSPWPTQNLRNGVYTTTIYATDTGGVLCSSNTGSGYTTAKLANPPAPPLWDGSPTAASDGSANVTFSFKKNAELDMVEYHILRQGPDGPRVQVVSVADPESSRCSLSGSTYTCLHTADDFPASYSGTYTYAINAWRSRPAFNSGETEKMCGSNHDSPCVGSASSDERSVTLTQPTPDPTTSPSPSPTGNPGNHYGNSTPGGGGSGGGSTPGTGGTKSGTSVLSFGQSRGSSYNDFYSGTYDENLPYQPKTLIIGGQGSTSSNGRTIEAASLAAGPPNYRTIMLPVAGGLLAFLSAAHVRRLLIHF